MNLSAEFQNVLNGSVDWQTVSFVFQTIPAHSKSSQLMQTVVPHSGYPAALCVQLGLYRTSHSFISCFTASYCIVLHYCMAYWRFILVSNWCSAPHCCCTVVLHGQQKNGFRLKSNWLKYTIFPRPSFKSCFKKEKKESAGQCRLTLKTWWPHKQDCLCSWASLRWNAVRKFNAVLPDGQEYYTQMSWHASL